jgi:hypothetical protein
LRTIESASGSANGQKINATGLVAGLRNGINGSIGPGDGSSNPRKSLANLLRPLSPHLFASACVSLFHLLWL